MSDAKHTPGLWIYSKGGRVLNADGHLVATAWLPEQVPNIKQERQPGESLRDASTRLKPKIDEICDQMEKNARLIAAAPELLEALFEVMFRHVHFSNKAEYAERARAAIAKATGEQK